MSYIPASTNRDLFVVLGVMVVALLAVGLRARARHESSGAGGPVEENESSGGSAGAATDAEASRDDDAAGGEAH